MFFKYMNPKQHCNFFFSMVLVHRLGVLLRGWTSKPVSRSRSAFFLCRQLDRLTAHRHATWLRRSNNVKYHQIEKITCEFMLTHFQYIWDWEKRERERHHLKSRCWVTRPLARPSSGLDKTFFIEEFAPRLFSEVRRHMSRLDQWVDLTANCSRLSRNIEELKLAPRILWHLQCSLLWLSLPYRLRVHCAAWLEWRHICIHGAQVRRVKLIQPRFGTNSKSGELFFFTYDHQHPGLHSSRFHNPTSGMVEPHRSKCGSTLS